MGVCTFYNVSNAKTQSPHSSTSTSTPRYSLSSSSSNLLNSSNPKHQTPACRHQLPVPLINILDRKTIVFDMDETLIHTSEVMTPGYEIKVPFKAFQGKVSNGFVNVRPYAK